VITPASLRHTTRLKFRAALAMHGVATTKAAVETLPCHPYVVEAPPTIPLCTAEEDHVVPKRTANGAWAGLPRLCLEYFTVLRNATSLRVYQCLVLPEPAERLFEIARPLVITAKGIETSPLQL